MADDTITLKIERTGETTVTLDRAMYEQAKAADELAELLDPYVSDMETETIVTEPGGQVGFSLYE